MPEETKKHKIKKIPLSDSQKERTIRSLEARKKNNSKLYMLPESRRTAENLMDFMKSVEKGINQILPKEKRQYVVYLRKSTDDELKQVRSLEDQKYECLRLAEDLKIRDDQIKVFEESASAKKSGNRPIFDKIMQGFENGKYHGLISWSPDRLSRNMKEAGEIIELIDLELIQDLRFKTYQFENTPNGKMMLGILFATSKQYSDKLAVDVARGITGNIKDGKYTGAHKKGYYVDKETGYFIPDAHNWDLLREAVSLRLYKGYTNIDVANFLNDNSFSKRSFEDDEYTLVKVSKQMVGNIFEDSFYFGLYKYGERLALLNEQYDFLPLMTPDEYIQLNKKMSEAFDKKYAGKSAQVKRLEFGLLRNKVICDYCDSIMEFQTQQIKRGKNEGKWLISYYCRNFENCLRHNKEEQKKLGIKIKKSIRAIFVKAAIEWTLRSFTIKSKEAYRLHIAEIESKLAQDKAIAKRKLKSAKADLDRVEHEYMKYQKFQVEHPKDYDKHHAGKLDQLEAKIEISKNSIEKNKKALDKLSAPLPTEKEFLELVQSYLERFVNSDDLVEQDAICREIVSNLRAGDDSVSVITLNKPYDLLTNIPKVSTGRGYRTRTCDLTVPNRTR